MTKTLRRWIDRFAHRGEIRMNLALADGTRVDAWVPVDDAARLWHA